MRFVNISRLPDTMYILRIKYFQTVGHYQMYIIFVTYSIRFLLSTIVKCSFFLFNLTTNVFQYVLYL